MDGIIQCPSCGNKLPEESSFCPYCMTKFTPEKQMDSNFKKSNKNIKIITVAVSVLLVVAAVVAVLIFGRNEALDESTENNGLDIPSGEATTVSALQSSVYDTQVGFMAGGCDDDGLSFFKSCFFKVEYSSLAVSESVYAGAAVKFECIVLKADGETVFVEYGATRGFDGIYKPTADYAVIKVRNTDGMLPGQSLVVYGTYEGVEDYVVGGKAERLPTFEMQSCTEFVYDGLLSPVFSKEKVYDTAKRIFGSNINVRESVRSDFADKEIADLLMDGGLFYTVESDYGNYCFYTGENSFVFDCASNGQTEKYILPAIEADNIYTCVIDNVSSSFTVSCLDENFNTLWCREFKNSVDAVYDYTSDYFYIVADTNLYVLDVSTGENAAAPKYVGARCGILKISDGLLLFSHTGEDAVTKADLYGNIIWRTSFLYDVSDSQGDLPPFAQLLESGYLINYEIEQDVYYTALVTDDGKLEYEYATD